MNTISLWIGCALASTVTSAIALGGAARGDAGIPPGFKPAYTIVKRESVDSPTAHRRKVQIVLPGGLTRATLEANLRHAARSEYDKTHAGAIAVFGYRKGTDRKWGFTAGKCEFAPGGKWERAADNVPVNEYKAVVELAPEYPLKK